MSFSVSCPCGCGHIVSAFDEGFSATTVEVEACQTLAADGICSSQMRKSWAYSHAVPTASPVQHRDGLVVFA